MNHRKLSAEELHLKGYKKGSIIRVKMHNFLTFDSAEVFPGPNLNVVLGPNGTGKSSITHAICLACGGSPKSLGRADDLSQFVKKGKEKEEAYAEVDVLNELKVETIRRTISSEDKSSKWMINGRSSTLKAVKAIMDDLSIDVDNLCTFMAQDKVGQFTLQTAQGILQMTLQCIKSTTDPEKTLYTEQCELDDIESVKITAERDLKVKQELVTSLESQLNSMQADVDRVNRREGLKELQGLYRVKSLSLAITEAVAKRTAKQEEVANAEARLREAQEVLQPLEENQRDLQRRFEAHELNVRDVRDRMERTERELKATNNRVEELDLSIENANNDLESVDRAKREGEMRLERLWNEVQKLKTELGNAQHDEASLRQRMSELSNQQHSISQERGNHIEQCQELKVQREELCENLSMLRRQVGGLQDREARFRKVLSDINRRDVLTALDWLNQNRHRLSGECFYPVGMYMDVQDPACVTILEKVVGFFGLFACVVNNREDEKLIRREMPGRVDVFTMLHSNPVNNAYSAEFRAQMAQEIGLQSQILDFVNMPPLVAAYCCEWKGLGKILWARGPKASSKISTEHLNYISRAAPGGSFQLFVHDTDSGGRGDGRAAEVTEFTARKSRYHDGPPSTTSIVIREGRVLRGGSDDQEDRNRREALEIKIKQLEHDIEVLNVNLRNKEEQCRQFDQQLQQISDEKKHVQMLLRAPANIRTKMESELRRYEDMKSELNRKDVAKEKAIRTKTLENQMNAYFESLRKVNELLRIINTITIEKAVVESGNTGLRQQLREAAEELKAARDAMREHDARLSAAKHERDEAVKEFHRAEKAGCDYVRECGEGKSLADMLKSAMQRCPENTRTDIDAKIEEIQLQLDAFINDPSVMGRYEAVKERLGEEQGLLKKLRIRFDEAEDGLHKRSANWVDCVQTLARKLNTSFGHFMSELQYRGEVVLKEVGTFKQYEMQMRVSFRINENMSDLNGQRHSGGERAVSTIMYLMALQNFTSSPFRVVDEINQGMDERNERLAFDRIVRSCCDNDGNGEQDKKPQYFLVSPKLLQGLRAMDNDNVTVLMVWNGPGIMDTWQIPQLIQSLKRKSGTSEQKNEKSQGIVIGGDYNTDSDEETLQLVKKARVLKG